MERLYKTATGSRLGDELAGSDQSAEEICCSALRQAIVEAPLPVIPALAAAATFLMQSSADCIV